MKWRCHNISSMTAKFIFINGFTRNSIISMGNSGKSPNTSKYVWQAPQEVKTIQLRRMRLEYFCKKPDSHWPYARAHQQTECHYSWDHQIFKLDNSTHTLRGNFIHHCYKCQKQQQILLVTPILQKIENPFFKIWNTWPRICCTRRARFGGSKNISSVSLSEHSHNSVEFFRFVCEWIFISVESESCRALCMLKCS